MENQEEANDPLLEMLQQAPDVGEVSPDSPDVIPDDLLESGSAEPRFLCSIGGVQAGPYSVRELQTLVNLGRLQNTDRLRREDSRCWIPCREFTELTFPASTAGASTGSVQLSSNDPGTAKDLYEFDEKAFSELTLEDFRQVASPARRHPSNGEQTPIVSEPAEINGDTERTKAHPDKQLRSRKKQFDPAAFLMEEPSELPRNDAALISSQPDASLRSSTETTGLATTSTVTAEPSATHQAVANSAAKKKPVAAPRRAKRDLGPITIPPGVYVLAGLVILLCVIKLIPGSSGALEGSVVIDGVPVPIGSVTITPSGGKTVSLNVIDGKFESAGDLKLPDGSCRVALIVGNALGMPITDLENTPFESLNGARFSKTMTFKASDGAFTIVFESAEAVPMKPGGTDIARPI